MLMTPSLAHAATSTTPRKSCWPPLTPAKPLLGLAALKYACTTSNSPARASCLTASVSPCAVKPVNRVPPSDFSLPRTEATARACGALLSQVTLVHEAAGGAAAESDRRDGFACRAKLSV